MGAHDPDDDSAHVDREAILARRRRFVAAALTGLTTSTLATACPCLKVAAPEPATSRPDDGDAVEEASPQDGGVPDTPEDEDHDADPDPDDPLADDEPPP